MESAIRAARRPPAMPPAPSATASRAESSSSCSMSAASWLSSGLSGERVEKARTRPPAMSAARRSGPSAAGRTRPLSGKAATGWAAGEAGIVSIKRKVPLSLFTRTYSNRGTASRATHPPGTVRRIAGQTRDGDGPHAPIDPDYRHQPAADQRDPEQPCGDGLVRRLAGDAVHSQLHRACGHCARRGGGVAECAWR